LPSLQWLDFFTSGSKTRLLNALSLHAETLGVLPPRGAVEPVAGITSRSTRTRRKRRAGEL
jgi:hypothetical protein